ncbi:succinylglutamate desuccinylase/aspartoacylase family protein [Oryzifoliimicrobium ureilyticus]|uniref:succinylglutamate desuccinylase/aspartoacylase family protein n=1 Tax=Oryzifoliimicrobium ureilyticus TaxID=3113724 RepID=UPI0030767F82
MEISELIIPGDTPGVSWKLPILSFKGQDPKAPKVYLQAALHADELPGAAVLHFLTGFLRDAETRGALLGEITIVPQANPFGAAQSHFGDMQGRFDLGSRNNFNRDFPLISISEKASLTKELDRLTAINRLKRHLLSMALDADLVLDLHCDDESLQYAYIDSAFWPEASDLAASLDMQAVLLSDGESSAFEEAVSYAWKTEVPGARKSRLPGKLSVTLELRGRRDVDADLARKDAEGLLRFLALRGLVKEDVVSHDFAGPALPLDNVEMIRAPEPGVVLFHHPIGKYVQAGDVVATLLTKPGFADGEHEVRAPQAGLILTRVSARAVRRGGDLMKIACGQPSKVNRKPGTLED